MAHILAVDDDADLRALIAEALGRDGHFVRTLAAGAALRCCRRRWAATRARSSPRRKGLFR